MLPKLRVVLSANLARTPALAIEELLAFDGRHGEVFDGKFFNQTRIFDNGRN
jgi:hypothetical protein